MKLNQLSDERIFCVYKITNLVNGKIYVGKTSDVDKRLSRHLKIAESKEEKAYQYLHRSINKYGADNFVIQVLEDKLIEADAFKREKFWIKQLNSKDPSVGMNLTDGGEGAAGLEWSEESRLNISGSNNHNFGKPLLEETKEKLSIANSGEDNPFYGKHHSDEVVDFLRNRSVSEEIKNKISEGCRGEQQWNSKFSDNDILEIRSKWESGQYTQTELAKQYGVKPNTVSQIVNRKRYTHI